MPYAGTETVLDIAGLPRAYTTTKLFQNPRQLQYVVKYAKNLKVAILFILIRQMILVICILPSVIFSFARNVARGCAHSRRKEDGEVGMSEQFKKAKKGLACCERRGYCEGHCPYYEPEKEALECTSELAHDALALISHLDKRIKELSLMQAARLMTLEETENDEVAWLEEYADPADGVEPIIQPVIIVWHENGCWHCLIDRNEDAGLDLFIDGLWTE